MSSSSQFFVRPAQTVVLLSCPQMTKLAEKVILRECTHTEYLFSYCLSRVASISGQSLFLYLWFFPSVALSYTHTLSLTSGRKTHAEGVTGTDNMEEVSWWLPQYIRSRRRVDQGLRRCLPCMLFPGRRNLRANERPVLSSSVRPTQCQDNSTILPRRNHGARR